MPPGGLRRALGSVLGSSWGDSLVEGSQRLLEPSMRSDLLWLGLLTQMQHHRPGTVGTSGIMVVMVPFNPLTI